MYLLTISYGSFAVIKEVEMVESVDDLNLRVLSKDIMVQTLSNSMRKLQH